MIKYGFLLSLLFFTLSSYGQYEYPILSMQERASKIDQMLKDKLENTLPALMDATGIDMWILISREYNEDPVLKTMLPATWLSARRRTILVLFKPKGADQVERFAVARYPVTDLFAKAWDKDAQPNQWQGLVDLIAEKKPQKIGINISEHFALADGINTTEHQMLMQALPESMAKRVVSAENLAIAWLETRSKMELAVYPSIVKMGHQIIRELYSNEVIQPGKTTTEDLVWWLRERSRELKLTNWFHPTVSIQRANEDKFDHLSTFTNNNPEVILPGDLLHLDFGITYLRLQTDQQQHAYVLREGESDAPAYLKAALANANRLQDIFTQRFAVGKTGNQILKESREQAIKEGITPSIYTHPIGYHGHAAGTTLGMWRTAG